MNDNSDNNLITLQLLVFGNVNVGKYSIINRYISNNYEPENKPMLNCGPDKTRISVDGITCILEIIEVIPETFHQYSPQLIKGIMLIYEINNKQTFDDIKKYYEKNFEFFSQVCCILVGNKLDLSKNRQVNKVEAEEFAKNNKIPFLEVSAKENINIKETFMKITHDMLEKEQEKQPKYEPNFFEKFCGC